MTLPQIPSVMHLTEEYIDKGNFDDCLQCPVALLLNEFVEGDWTAYTAPSCSYIFPSRSLAVVFNSLELQDAHVDAIAMGAYKLVHEDRLYRWICEFDMGEDMYTCHIFWQDDSPDFLYMNRTGRNKQKENLND